MNQHGFTLIEMMLSISIVVILVGLSLPFYQSFQTRNDLATTAQTVAETVRRAQTYARGVSGDSVWSVEVQSSAITLFKGTSFSARDMTYDEAVSIPASISVSGSTEFQFSKLSGAPNTAGTITLSSTGQTARTVSINAKGMVQD